MRPRQTRRAVRALRASDGLRGRLQHPLTVTACTVRRAPRCTWARRCAQGSVSHSLPPSDGSLFVGAGRGPHRGGGAASCSGVVCLLVASAVRRSCRPYTVRSCRSVCRSQRGSHTTLTQLHSTVLTQLHCTRISRVIFLPPELALHSVGTCGPTGTRLTCSCGAGRLTCRLMPLGRDRRGRRQHRRCAWRLRVGRGAGSSGSSASQATLEQPILPVRDPQHAHRARAQRSP